MRNRSKNRLVAGLILAAAILVYLWAYPLNQGWAEVKTGLDNATLTAGSQVVNCAQDPCKIKLKTGTWQLKIQKEGYFEQTIEAKIGRLKTAALSVELKRIPGLEAIETEPTLPSNNKDIPPKVVSLSPRGTAWTSDGAKLAFWDPGDQRLKIWNKENGIGAITPLKGMSESLSISWSTDGATLLAYADREIYWIDTVAAARKKAILDFAPQNPAWSPKGDVVWVNDNGGSVYGIRSNDLSAKKIRLNVNLVNGVWLNGESFVYFTTDTKTNKTVIAQYNISTDQSAEVVAKYNFPVSKVVTDGQGAVFFLNPDENRWYRLRF